jgi:glycine cleavage system H protein
VNADAFGAWIYRLRPDDPSQVERLLDAEGYRKAASS